MAPCELGLFKDRLFYERHLRSTLAEETLHPPFLNQRLGFGD
jgi:hypothetical protein